MKKIGFTLLAVIISLSLFAQDNDEFQTIFDGHITKVRGFGGPFMAFTGIGGDFAHLMGGGGGLILNDQLIFGGFGLGLSNGIDAYYKDPTTGLNLHEGLQLDYGFGGLWFGYIVNGSMPIHPVIHTQVGWGSVGLREDFDYNPVVKDAIFVLNPIIEIDMNITRFFRLAVGANYRVNFGLSSNKIKGYSDADFSGPGGFLSFKFGWF